MAGLPSSAGDILRTSEVLAWPGTLVVPPTGLLVVSLLTTAGHDRTQARKQVRQALREILGLLLPQPPELIDVAGQALRVKDGAINLSVSHAPGLSVAAINLYGSVGVDVMQLDEGADSLPDWQRVAHDYLGPAAASRITCTYEFAQEWTRREAQLKCCGLGITEWDATQKLRYGKTMMLALPDGYVGCVVQKNLPMP